RRTAERFAVLLPSKIVNYAEARKGKKVDAAGRTLEGNADVRAECTDLVKAALDQAGAKPGDFTDPNNYVWGKLEPRRLSRLSHPHFSAASSIAVVAAAKLKAAVTCICSIMMRPMVKTLHSFSRLLLHHIAGW